MPYVITLAGFLAFFNWVISRDFSQYITCLQETFFFKAHISIDYFRVSKKKKERKRTSNMIKILENNN